MIAKKFWSVLLIIAFIFSATACLGNKEGLHISDAYMAFDEAGALPTKTYAQGDVFYCLVTVRNAPEGGASLKVIWYAVNVKGMAYNSKIQEIETTAREEVVPFILTNDGPWPTGSYKAVIYLNGELDRTIRFKVK